MRSLLFTLVAFSLFLVAGCSKDSDDCDECVLLGYVQTQCADPWGYGVDGSDIAVEYALRDYFASTGVTINTVSIQGAAQPVTNCTACSCPTGKTIYALVDSANSSALTRLGFYR